LPSNSSDEAGAALRPVRPTAAASRVRKETSNDIPPVQVPTAPQDDSSAPIAIDWAREAELAATRRLRADEEAARRATAFSARKGPSLAVAKPLPPKFGWSHAQTQRVESVPGVGTLINLNDRCAILITFMLIPICKLGKIDARGDLFEHMDDPAPLGESLRELP